MNSLIRELRNPTDDPTALRAIEVLGCNGEIVATQDLIQATHFYASHAKQRIQTETDQASAQEIKDDGCAFNSPPLPSKTFRCGDQDEEIEESDITTATRTIFRTVREFSIWLRQDVEQLAERCLQGLPPGYEPRQFILIPSAGYFEKGLVSDLCEGITKVLFARHLNPIPIQPCSLWDTVVGGGGATQGVALICLAGIPLLQNPS